MYLINKITHEQMNLRTGSDSCSVSGDTLAFFICLLSNYVSYLNLLSILGVFCSFFGNHFGDSFKTSNPVPDCPFFCQFVGHQPCRE